MTWLGKRKTHIVESWLDRAMTNDECKSMFLASRVEYLEMIESDHRPAIIKIQRSSNKGNKTFHYDTRFGQNTEVSDIVKQGWNVNINGHVSAASDQIISCKKELAYWKRHNNTNSAINSKRRQKISMKPKPMELQLSIKSR